MKIGFLGGSFDPVHLGHLQFAQKMLSGLDEIWFSPAHISPFKLDNPPHVSDAHRLEMLKIALKDYPAFKLYEGEILKEGPSFTVDTLEQLVKDHPKDQFFLLLGEDTAKSFHQWKNPERIQELASLLVGERSAISSTHVRERLKNNLDCSAYLPEKIIDYITLHRLYL